VPADLARILLSRLGLSLSDSDSESESKISHRTSHWDCLSLSLNFTSKLLASDSAATRSARRRLDMQPPTVLAAFGMAP